MAAVDDPKTLGRTRLSFANEAEVDEFADTLDKFERGELTADQWRAYRLVRGNYGQRQDVVQMIRIKVPQGVLDGPQLQALADVADTWSRGFGHITTRQNVQFHFLQPHDVELAMRRVAEAGLTTREACGSAVRNITGCPYAGVAADEVFDVTPYAEALTRYLLRHPLSSSLPRKFKIAFEGCTEDHAVAAINDIGWYARVRGSNGTGRRGFRVTVGGGTSILCRSGYELYEFLPAGEIFEVAEAIIRVFHRLGDYAHKQRNRMKFLIRDLGFEGWRTEFEKERAALKAEGGPQLPFDPERPPVEAPPAWDRPPAPGVAEAATRTVAAEVRGPGVVPRSPRALTVRSEEASRWLRTNVRSQKQDGYAIVTVTLPLGDLTGAQMRLLADLALAYGDGTVRVTPDQDLMLRWVRRSDVRDLHRRLEAGGLGLPDAGTLADVTSCPGAESCRLAVTQSRGLGKLPRARPRQRPHPLAAGPRPRLKI